MKHIFAAATFTLLSASAVFAQDCTPVTSIDQLVGDYEITNGPGQLINVPQIGTLPAAAEATLTAKLTKHGDALGLDSEVFGSLVIDFSVVTAENEKWSFDYNETFQSASSEDIALVLDCGDHSELLRILGTGTTSLPNVGIKPVTMYLTVFSSEFIIGRMDIPMDPTGSILQTKIRMEKID